LLQNAALSQRILAAAIPIIAREQPPSIAHTALGSALVTSPDAMAERIKQRLGIILGERR
jgi:5'-methylthioadenosine phosphorylase